jgi:hypothetical protein
MPFPKKAGPVSWDIPTGLSPLRWPCLGGALHVRKCHSHAGGSYSLLHRYPMVKVSTAATMPLVRLEELGSALLQLRRRPPLPHQQQLLLHVQCGRPILYLWCLRLNAVGHCAAARPAQFPFMVALFRRDIFKTVYNYCGGSLIGPTSVLTAGKFCFGAALLWASPVGSDATLLPTLCEIREPAARVDRMRMGA